MRMRKKPWAEKELAESAFFVDVPSENRGKWNRCFVKAQPLHLELGCGKGGFISQMSVLHPENNYIGIDITDKVLGLAKRNVEKANAAEGRAVTNVLLCAQDIERINMIFSESDTIDRIYINFCNPWNKPSQRKKRLTHPRQLVLYKQFLRENGEIWFKTDDDTLFKQSVEYFIEQGFEIKYRTTDLHNSSFTESIPTEHEKMFTEMGIPTKFLIAVYKQKAE